MYQKSWWYHLLFLRYRVQQTEIGNYESFSSLSTPKKTKKSEFWRNKKNAGDIIILQTYKNHNHMRYGSWDRQNVLPFWAIFCPYEPGKSKFWKNKEVSGDVIISNMCTTNHDHIIIYASWDVECDRLNFLSFRVIFCPFTPLLTLNLIWNKC